MNLVGHVAVAVRAEPGAPPALLGGAMLPDLGAIARVRLRSSGRRPAGDAARDVDRGIALHHASDAAFHASPWFLVHHVALRDALLDARVDRGAARAAAHAGLEMLLDGHLIADPEVARATDAAFAALAAPGPAHDAALALAAPADRYVWGERLDHLAGALDPQSYSSARGVARRLERMTRGRTRIELRSEHVETVAGVLEGYVPVVARDGARVVDDVLVAV